MLKYCKKYLAEQNLVIHLQVLTYHQIGFDIAFINVEATWEQLWENVVPTLFQSLTPTLYQRYAIVKIRRQI